MRCDSLPWLRALCALVALVMLITSCDNGSDGDKKADIAELEQRLFETNSELEKLASYSLRSGVGAVGYRSQVHQTSKNPESIEIDLGQNQPIDEVVLVPTIWRDTKTGFRADGFPLEFRIVVGTGDDRVGTVIASYGKEDQLLPRIAPLIVPCHGVKATWVRLEVTELSPRAWDGLYILQLFEILVFNGEANVALHQPVTVSSPDVYEGVARDKKFLVDGFVPYLMDASEGEQSLAFVTDLGSHQNASLSIDLGKPYPLNRIHLHNVDISDTVPQVEPSDFGMPRHLVVEGANQPDFSDAKVLTEYRMKTIHESGPIIIRRFPEMTCRYVRIIILEPFSRTLEDQSGHQSGFAEIELFSHDRNVALGKTAQGDLALFGQGRSYASLTDGNNLYGHILPIRAWLSELAKRHDLEVKRPQIVAELDLRYETQKKTLSRLIILTILLAAGILVILLLSRMLRMRQMAHMRERLAADLHDELGANLHTIGLLSDLASETHDDPEELSTLHRRIRSETERSGTAVRHCMNMLEASALNSDIEEDMNRASRRIMAKLDHAIVIEGKPILDKLKPRVRIDLFLFYKECLINISRHSEATSFESHLAADNHYIVLTVKDNGKGLDQQDSEVPKSLKRRAHLLRAKVSVESPASAGTIIKLILPIRRWGNFKSILQ